VSETKVRMNRITTAGWIAAALFAGIFFSSDWLTAWRGGNLGTGGGTIIGRDFVNLFTGGRLVLEGKLSTIYDLDAYSAYQLQMSGGLVLDHLYSYPPVTFLYVWFFGLFPYPVAYVLWLSLTGAAFAYAARPYLAREGLPAWLALVVPASLINIWSGHYGFLLGALWLGAWRCVDDRPRTAGLLVGMMVIKPHLAVLWPILLIRRRAWTAFATAGITALGLIALSALLFGLEPWRIYVGQTMGEHASRVDEVQAFFLSMMPTIAPALFRLELAPALVWTIQLAVAAAVIAVLWLRMPEDRLQAGLAAACATFLVTPFGFTYDMTVVSIAALVMLRHETERRPLAALVLLLAFLVPLITIFFNRASLPIPPLLVAGLFALLLQRQDVLKHGGGQAKMALQPA